MEDAGFQFELEHCNNAGEIKKLFAEHGIPFTAENVQALTNQLNFECELDTLEMATVTGGSFVSDAIALATKLLSQLKHGGGVGKHF